MLSKLKFLLLYFLSWVIFFDLMRLVFLLYHLNKTKHLSAADVFGTFTHGLRMDLAVSAYILAPVCLFVLLSLFIHYFRRLQIYKIYTVIVLLIIALISLSDLEIYNAWGFRIDATPLHFLSTPREALASVSHLPLLWILIVFILCYALFYFCFTYMLRRIFFQQQNRFIILTAVLLLLFTGSLIIPIRGGLQLAPLNQSSVYFSTNNFANHAAINPSWNFLHSVLSKENTTKNPYLYFSKDRDKQIVEDSLYNNHSVHTDISKFIANEQPVNVIVIIWESFTEKAIHVTRNGKEITPQFNRLRNEGIYFSNLYASGDRTNKGIPAILSGYPAMPNTTIIHSPGKSAKLKSLPQLFRAKGYETSFFYGGEPEFANIKSYLLHSEFNPIIGRNDFASKDMNSKWGAHDGVVMNRVIADLNKTKQPFFSVWLTLSSHEPFETPVPTVIEGQDNESKFLNSLHYTDQVLGDFIAQCSQQAWWKNTVIVITGDHGHPLPNTGSTADNFRTPMLWLGGALKQKGVVIDKILSQIDIANTLGDQVGLGINQNYFPFSKNALDPNTRPWAFFSFNNGFGYVDTTGRIVFDNVGKQIIERNGLSGENQAHAGKALMQYFFEDFINK